MVEASAMAVRLECSNKWRLQALTHYAENTEPRTWVRWCERPKSDRSCPEVEELTVQPRCFYHWGQRRSHRESSVLRFLLCHQFPNVRMGTDPMPNNYLLDGVPPE